MLHLSQQKVAINVDSAAPSLINMEEDSKDCVSSECVKTECVVKLAAAAAADDDDDDGDNDGDNDDDDDDDDDDAGDDDSDVFADYQKLVFLIFCFFCGGG